MIDGQCKSLGKRATHISMLSPGKNIINPSTFLSCLLFLAPEMLGQSWLEIKIKYHVVGPANKN